MEDYQLVTDHLPKSARVLFFTGREALSELFRFEVIVAMSAEDGLAFEMDEAHCKQAALVITPPDDGAPCAYAGWMTSLELVHEFAEHAVYAVTLEPVQTDTRLARRSAVFTPESGPTDLAGLLDHHLSKMCAYDRSRGYYQVELSRRYPERLHVCQYNESDYAFLSRIAEREGVYFYLAPPDTQAGHAPFDRMVFTDDKGHHKPWRASPARFFAGGASPGHQLEAFETFRPRCVSVEAAFGERDYHGMTPALVEGDAASERPGSVATWWGSNFDRDDRGRRLANDRLNEANARHKVFKARGRVFGVRSGYLFELDEHPRAAFNARYLAVEVEHRGNRLAEVPALARALGLEVSARAYEVEVTAIPATQQYAPPRKTPVPRIYGVETATVDGPTDSEYAQLDEHGRYKVKVHFDEREDTQAGNRSMWVRMLQPHAGERYGQHFPLKMGTEVMLVFLGGDPDRPVISGATYNPSTPSPVTRDNPSQHFLYTKAGNLLLMDDERDREWVHLYSPHKHSLLHLGVKHSCGEHNWVLRTEGNGLLQTGGDEDVEVGGNLSEHVAGDVKETYDGNQDTTVAGNKDLKVGGDEGTVIGGDRFDSVGGSENRSVGGNLSQSVGGSRDIKVGGSDSLKVGGSRSTLVSGSTDRTTGGAVTESLGGDHTTTVGGSSTTVVAGSTTCTSGGAIQITSGAGITLTAPRIEKVTPDLFECDATKLEATGLKVEFTGSANAAVGMKVEAVGVTIEGTGVKAEAIGLARAAIGLVIENCVVKVELVGAHMEVGLHLIDGISIFK